MRIGSARAALGSLARRWKRTVVVVVTCAALVSAAALAIGLFTAVEVYHVYTDRDHLPDDDAFAQFDFPTIGRVHDRNGRPLIEFAREYRQITPYAEVPPIVRDAIVATEDKHFFSHNGIDYTSVPRVVAKVRLGAWATRLATRRQGDDVTGRAIFPQGGSTITQQLVRGVFLQHRTAEENSYQLQNIGLLPRILSSVIGARNVNMVLRKREEMRLSIWIEQRMRERFGSKRRAKEEILARYASFVYMGNAQYGFASAAEYYFGQPLSSLTAADADKVALLAGIAKSPRDYAPTAPDRTRILRRRNQTLELMAARGAISRDEMAAAIGRALPIDANHDAPIFQSSAVVSHVLRELTDAHAPLGIEDLLQGRIQVESTVDGRVQRLANDALRHGLERYEQRRPRVKSLAQGSVVVLKNSDGSILAEVGGRELYEGRATTYSDFNRVSDSLRQPGSAMKPIVYLAAFRQGDFTLDTLVPDEPISVSDGADTVKWIANYDGRFKGLIPARMALAESRNAVAVWIAERVGIGTVLETARSLGVRTVLQPYPTTALGASEMTLLELATVYRTIASGVLAQPYIIRRIVRGSGGALRGDEHAPARLAFDTGVLALIQEGLRGVVRIPTGTAHALDAPAFPIPVMGKTGTTNDFRDALFVGSTYGADGVTVAVRIGFDDGRSLGPNETGGRVALPVFEELMLAMYRDRVFDTVPSFPDDMEERITAYLTGGGSAPPEPLSPHVLTTSSRLLLVAPGEAKAWLTNHGPSR